MLNGIVKIKKMKRPEIYGWKVTTNENGIKMATLPRDTMEEILKYVEYADKQLRLNDVIGRNPNAKRKMTEEQIKELGWKLVKQYNHDQYRTNRYKLGCMEIEFTYESKELLTHDVTISELNCMAISFYQAKMLTELIGHWSE